MQGIYNYIHGTNRVSRVYSVAAVLYLQFVLYVMLFCPWNMFCAFTLTLSVVCVPIWLFPPPPLSSCFCGMLLRYCLSDLEMVSVTPIITGITFALTFHMRQISVMRYLYFKTFSASLLITFLSPGIADCSVYYHACSLFNSMDYDVQFIIRFLLLLLMVWYCCECLLRWENWMLQQIYTNLWHASLLHMDAV